MYNHVNSFGEYIAEKREQKRITLREMAGMLNITAPYLSDIEKDRRNPPEKAKLDEIGAILGLSEEEQRVMYDLAGKKRNTVSPDLPDYIMERDYVRAALRVARDVNAGEKEWLKFVKELEKRRE